MKRVAIYLRVSTGEQTTEHQRRELEEAASRRGWVVAKVYEDAGISGAKGRSQRPALDAMLKDATRRRFDMIAAWSVDRLGRSLRGLVEFLDEIRAVGCGLYLHQQALDTSTPAGEAMFGMIAVFAQFERAMIRDRVNAGLATAKSKGVRLGRPTVGQDTEQRIRALRTSGLGKLKIARELRCGVSTVSRVLASTGI